MRKTTHLKKWELFYKEKGLKFKKVEFNGYTEQYIPIANCICIFCGQSKQVKQSCGKSCCRTGNPCDLYVDGERLLKYRENEREDDFDPNTLDYDKEWFVASTTDTQLTNDEIKALKELLK